MAFRGFYLLLEVTNEEIAILEVNEIIQGLVNPIHMNTFTPQFTWG